MAARFDKFTVKAQEALQAANEMAARSGQQQIEPLHILWALIAQGDGVVPPLLEKLGAPPASLASEAEKNCPVSKVLDAEITLDAKLI